MKTMQTTVLDNAQYKEDSLMLMESFFREFPPEKANGILNEWMELRLARNEIEIDTKDEQFSYFFLQLDKLVVSTALLWKSIELIK